MTLGELLAGQKQQRGGPTDLGRMLRNDQAGQMAMEQQKQMMAAQRPNPHELDAGTKANIPAMDIVRRAGR